MKRTQAKAVKPGKGAVKVPIPRWKLYYRDRGKWVPSSMVPFRSIAAAKLHAEIIGARKISIRRNPRAARATNKGAE